jgi:hypothetical protein
MNSAKLSPSGVGVGSPRVSVMAKFTHPERNTSKVARSGREKKDFEAAIEAERLDGNFDRGIIHRLNERKMIL